MKNISISVLLAPYRVEYYNYISKNLNCECFFLYRNYTDYLFTEEEVLRRCSFVPKFLKGKALGRGRKIAGNLYSIIRKNNPRFVISPEFSFITFQLILMKLFFRFKLIVKSDDSYSMITNGGFSKVHSFARNLCMPFVDEVILCDSKTVNWYRKKYKKGIWLPIIQDENIFDNEEIEKYRALSEKYKEDYELRDVKTILFVGRLVEVKNVSLLIVACSKLSFPYKLIIVGEGVLREQLEKLSNKLCVNISFVGQKNGDELFAWYQAADIFVLPSTIEPFGAVTNEALLNGCNCIISEKAGSSCLIEDGKNGFLFNPSDVDDLVKKIEITASLPISNHQSKMSKSFLEYMDDAFSRVKEMLNK